LPHVTSQIMRATGAGVMTVDIGSYGRRPAHAPIVCVAASMVEAISPRIAIRCALRRVPVCGLLPLGLARQPPALSSQLDEPGDEGHGVMPGDIDHRMIHFPSLRTPIRRPLLPGAHKAGELGDGERIRADVIRAERYPVLRLVIDVRVFVLVGVTP